MGKDHTAARSHGHHGPDNEQSHEEPSQWPEVRKQGLGQCWLGQGRAGRGRSQHVRSLDIRHMFKTDSSFGNRDQPQVLKGLWGTHVPNIAPLGQGHRYEPGIGEKNKINKQTQALAQD